MHNTYAIIDIGSNTIVLVVYEVNDKEIHQIYYESIAAHLVGYIENNTMSAEGIRKAFETVSLHIDYCLRSHIENIYADITECGRNITNSQELIDTVKKAGAENVRLLSGREEAMCDYYGAQLDTNLESGLLIDIGGGSTEFVRFENKKVLDAVSIPLGCVRLSKMKYDPEISLTAIQEMRQSHPLITNTEEALGIGGTIRAAHAACADIMKTGRTFTMENLEELYAGLLDENPIYLDAVRRNVTPDRAPVFLPGLGMLVAAGRCFHIKTFKNSNYGVREGYLLHFVLKRV